MVLFQLGYDFFQKKFSNENEMKIGVVGGGKSEKGLRQYLCARWCISFGSWYLDLIIIIVFYVVDLKNSYRTTNPPPSTPSLPSYHSLSTQPTTSSLALSLML